MIPLSYRRFIRAYIRFRDLEFPEPSAYEGRLGDELADVYIDLVQHAAGSSGLLERVANAVRLSPDLLTEHPADHDLQRRLDSIVEREPALQEEVEPYYRYLQALAKVLERARLVVAEDTAVTRTRSRPRRRLASSEPERGHPPGWGLSLASSTARTA